MKIPWRRAWQPTSVFLPGESPWTEKPGRLSPQVKKSQTQLKWLSTNIRVSEISWKKLCIGVLHSVDICWAFIMHRGLPRWCSGQGRRPKRCEFNPWVRRILWRRKWQPTPIFLPRQFYGWRVLIGYSPWSHRVRHDWVCMYTHASDSTNHRGVMSKTDNPCPYGTDDQVEKTTHKYDVIWENHVGEVQGAMIDKGRPRTGLGSLEVAPKLE